MPFLSKQQLFFALLSTPLAASFSPSALSPPLVSQSSPSLPLSSSPSFINTSISNKKCGPRCAPRKNNRTAALSLSGNNNNAQDNDNTSSSCWNPNLRKVLATLSAMGVMETGYLTYDKVVYNQQLLGISSGSGTSLVDKFCTGNNAASSSCNDILHGPYASLHLMDGIDIPLSALGMVAYSTVLILAVFPLLNSDNSTSEDSNGGMPIIGDANNRIALLGATTLMASFSTYLVSLIIGVLHASCVFCFVSAGLSISMAGVSWWGGALPSLDAFANVVSNRSDDVKTVVELRKKGVTVGASSVGFATIMALVLFLGVDNNNSNNNNDLENAMMASTSSIGSGSSSTLVASTSNKAYEKNVPPPITTTSTPFALTLASDLSTLNARMFGAFWCSHCYEQKQTFGYEAMQSIPYVECDKEGYRNQRDVCRERDVPGYPTWEIGGKLFPGERSLDELREIVDGVLSK